VKNNQKRFQLEQIYLLLTRKCNLSCSHCIRSSNPYFTELIDKKLAFSIIEKLSEVSSEASMLLSGGEPTLHPDFYEIASKSADAFRNVVVNTNGLRYKQLKEVSKLPNVSIQISIDGDEVAHDKIRGDGTYKKTLLNISKLSGLGVNVIVATTVTKHNYQSISALDRDLSVINFTYWNVKRVVGSGRADDSDDLTTSVWNDFVYKIKNETMNIDRLRIAKMFSNSAFNNAVMDFVGDKYVNIFRQNCGTGRSKLYINPNGTVYPCACMEEVIIGDFSLESTVSILGNISSMSIEPQKEASCHKCPAWELCHGGCPGAAKRTKFPTLGDPRCPSVSKGLINYGL
jgi:radical SAM protein with 4Fe4S-binding SPASM domain